MDCSGWGSHPHTLMRLSQETMEHYLPRNNKYSLLPKISKITVSGTQIKLAGKLVVDNVYLYAPASLM